jgi:hypothetical protein
VMRAFATSQFGMPSASSGPETIARPLAAPERIEFPPGL